MAARRFLITDSGASIEIQTHYLDRMRHEEFYVPPWAQLEFVKKTTPLYHQWGYGPAYSLFINTTKSHLPSHAMRQVASSIISFLGQVAQDITWDVAEKLLTKYLGTIVGRVFGGIGTAMDYIFPDSFASVCMARGFIPKDSLDDRLVAYRANIGNPVEGTQVFYSFLRQT